MAEAGGAEFDRRMLAAAIRLGVSALGATSPNPAVGAIVVNDGSVVGRGRTAPGGRPHGETIALEQAGAAARGATLYVSLEPCSHHGRTPPCADAVIAAGIARVVAPAADPDPRVAGRGFARLREAGVEVVTGLLAVEAGRAHAGHIARTSGPLPHITLKLAVSADDAIGRRGEGKVPVTGDIARRYVQALRTRFDAIVVGRGTVETDDPELTSRLPGLEARSPVRVVLDTEARLGSHHRIFAEGSAPTWVLSAVPATVADERVRRFSVPLSTLGGLDPWVSMYRLSDEGVTRLLVEGGARIARTFLEADLVDEALLFRSPAALGGDIVPALAGLPLAFVEDSERFRRVGRRMFGVDSMTRYERTH